MLTLGAIGMVCAALLAALALKEWFGFSRDITAGLFAGSQTSSPALAVAVEMGHDSEAPAAFGVAYLSGAISVDSISSLTLNLKNGSAYTGAINTSGQKGTVAVSVP